MNDPVAMTCASHLGVCAPVMTGREVQSWATRVEERDRDQMTRRFLWFKPFGQNRRAVCILRHTQVESRTTIG